MCIYLYVKTHNKTGLKYLGKTQSRDPHKYPGSGVYWTAHLKKHGHDYVTEIIQECQTKEELRKWGLYYSNLWNIVESNAWANLKEEVGDGGRQSEEVRKRIGEAGKGRTPWNKGKQVWNDEERKKIGERNKARGPQSPETIAKRILKNTGKTRSEEQRKRSSEAQKGKILTEEHRASLRGPRPRVIPHNEGIKTGVPGATAMQWRITMPDGSTEQISSLRFWAEQHSISYVMLHRFAKQNRPYKGYFVQSI